MIRIMRSVFASSSIADGAAIGSISAASYTWLAQAEPVFHIIAAAIAIVAGIYSIAWHRHRLRAGNDKKDKT